MVALTLTPVPDDDSAQAAEHGRAGATRPAVVGKVTKHALAADPAQNYYLYVPSGGGNARPVFVSVHGISRNTREHAERFAPIAERYGVVVVAPQFPEDRFPDYQRLDRKGGAGRADLVLERILDDVAKLTGSSSGKVYLFGYSGGGQFVHRFAMAHPDRVHAYVVGAAGWYTFPDPNVKYPRGVKGAQRWFGADFDLRRFLAIPATVMVGERDVHPGTAMRQGERVEDQQGATRFERGMRWVEAMNQAAHEAGLAPHFEFVALARSPHSFTKSMRRGKMGERVFECLFGPQPERS